MFSGLNRKYYLLGDDMRGQAMVLNDTEIRGLGQREPEAMVDLKL